MGAVRLQVSELILRKLTGYMCSRVKTPQIPPFADGAHGIEFCMFWLNCSLFETNSTLRRLAS